MDIQLSDDGCGDDNFSLHRLNDDCLLKIFSYLWKEDARRLSQTSKRLKNLWGYRFRKFTFDFYSDMLSKTTPSGRVVLDVILMEYGADIRSWQLSIRRRFKEDAFELLRRVSKFSTNLKQLKFQGVTSMNFLDLNCPELTECLANVETLSFVCCGKIDRSDFFQHFRSLKQLYFEESGTTSCNLQILFRNNTQIEMFNFNESRSFLGDGSREETFSNGFGLCEFGPKFNSLCLGLSQDSPNDDLEMLKMLRLSTSHLTRLKLDLPSVKHIGTFLAKLAEQDTLEELELVRIEVSLQECMVLQSFRNLRLLVFYPKQPKFVLFNEEDETDWANLFETWPWYPVRLGIRTNITMTLSSFTQVVNQIHLDHLHLESITGEGQLYVEEFLRSLPPNSPPRTFNLVLHKFCFLVECRRKKVVHCGTLASKDLLKIDFNIAPLHQRKVKSFAY
ncbi:uncharacterized protein LOC119080456 [Bradysia coprophila]|uniref:uncharacterized protein LOC119080456 n=1 Tax=Bradysia coprophila TaxID=38358 RepID=UPI00187D762E|nr:uncharacterized protein LOC119080456 [Bradysia coprophila]